MLRGWMIYNRESAKKNERYIQFYREEGNKRDISFQVILVEHLEFGVKGGTWSVTYKGEEIELPDFVVGRTIYPLLSEQLEMMGVPVFNCAKTARICNDKALTYQYVAQLNIPMIDTKFVRNEELIGKLDLCEEHKPMVVKAVAGHGGSQVFLYEKGSAEAEYQRQEILDGIGSSDVVMQPMTGNKHQDLRVYVVGNEIVACVLRTAKTGFKSNFSLGGDVCLYELSDQERDHVTRIMQLFDLGLAGIDFLIGDQGELIFNEIEDVVGARMLYQCSDINLVGRYLDYIVKQIISLT